MCMTNRTNMEIGFPKCNSGFPVSFQNDNLVLLARKQAGKRGYLGRQNQHIFNTDNMKILNILSILGILVCCACQNHTFSVNQCPSQKVICDSSEHVCKCSKAPTESVANYSGVIVGKNQTIELSTQSQYKVIEHGQAQVELEVSIVIVVQKPPTNYSLLFQLFYFSQADQIYNKDNYPFGFISSINKQQTFPLNFYVTLHQKDGQVEKLVINVSILGSTEANITMLVTISKINSQVIIIIAASAASILAVAAVAFIVFCLYKRHKARVEEGKKIDYKEQLVAKFKEFTPEILAKSIHIPKMSTCSICLGDFDPEDKIRKIICNHIFHSDCIDSWCKKNLTCPVCRLDLDEQYLKKKKKQIEMTEYNWQENPLSVREELLFDEKHKKVEQTISKA